MKLMEDTASSFQRRHGARLPSAPRVAILSSDASPASFAHALRLGRALSALGWSHELCLPDGPSRCHPVARMQAIDAVSADIIICVNCESGLLRPLLPEKMPIISWFTPEASVPTTIGRDSSSKQWFVASSPSVEGGLRDAGIQDERILHIEVAADDILCASALGDKATAADTPVDIAILADLPDDRPEANDVILSSHITLWHAMQEEVRRGIDRYTQSGAEKFLEAALAKSGVTLQEAEIRKHFLALLCFRIVPATVMRSAVEAVQKGSHRVGLWGCNWAEVGGQAESWRGLIPDGEKLRDLFMSARVVLFPTCSSSVMQTMLDALLVRVWAVCRKGEVPLDHTHPGLADVIPYLETYRSARELNDKINRLLAGDPNCAARAESARDLVLKNHTVTLRLEQVVERLRAARETIPA